MASFITVKVKDTATLGLKRYLSKTITSTIRNLTIAGDVLLREVKKNVSPSPNYSLAVLKVLGHPYSRRFWHVKQGERRGQPLGGTPAVGLGHDPYWMVNVQTNKLRASLTRSSAFVTPQRIEIRVGVPTSAEANQYARHVIYGTKRMVPRDFLGNTLDQNREKIRGLLWNINKQKQ